jgi:drug/metabolite transporter (DMT)-like permease
MFLGTPRRWWIAAAVPLVLGLVLLVTGDGTMQRTLVAILLLITAMVLFGMAPMRYGQGARTLAESTPEPPPATSSAANSAPESRPSMVGRDAAEV